MSKASFNAILGFDFGLKRIGVAVGQRFTRTASPVTTLAAHEGVPNWSQVSKVIQAWKPDALIVGIPLNMDDTISAMAERAEAFAKELEVRFQLPVFRIDERLSTFAAKNEFVMIRGKALKRGQKVDSYAAALLIESWFNTFP